MCNNLNCHSTDTWHGHVEPSKVDQASNKIKHSKKRKKYYQPISKINHELINNTFYLATYSPHVPMVFYMSSSMVHTLLCPLLGGKRLSTVLCHILLWAQGVTHLPPGMRHPTALVSQENTAESSTMLLHGIILCSTEEKEEEEDPTAWDKKTEI